jgi:FeS assembly SUF system protein
MLESALQTFRKSTREELEEQIIAALKSVYDPEIPVDIYELGLIYELNVDPDSGHVDISMTLTAPGCPVAGSMPEWVRNAVENVPGVESVNVELAWEPPWTPDMMSMRAKLELNMI